MLSSWHQKLLAKNVMSEFRSPNRGLGRELLNRHGVDRLRFFLRFFFEEVILFWGIFRCWMNKQLLLSYPVTTGSDLLVGPYRLKLFLPEKGTVRLGNKVILYTPLELAINTQYFDNPRISIGDFTHVGPGCSIRAAKSISVGKHCLLGPNVTIVDTNAHPLEPTSRINREPIPMDEIRPVNIGDNVWIGQGAFVTPGVRIGEGAVIGANSVVIKDVPKNTIVVGNPARVAGWIGRKKGDTRGDA